MHAEERDRESAQERDGRDCVFGVQSLEEDKRRNERRGSGRRDAPVGTGDRDAVERAGGFVGEVERGRGGGVVDFEGRYADRNLGGRGGCEG